MRVTVLCSGSAGNSILVESGATRLLVDAGMQPRELSRRMDRSAAGVRLDDVEGVLCTHEHGDHGAGVPALASAGLAVYATAGTARALNLTGAVTVCSGSTLSVGALEIVPVSLPHDAAEPVGFIVRDAGGSTGVIVDCGRPTQEVAEAFAGCDVLVLETNYDPDLLRAGPYPPGLKRRIGGANGHLSNSQAGDLLRLMKQPRAQVLILAHLSQENNKPRLARAAVEKALAELACRPRVLVAGQDKAVAPIRCDNGTVAVQPGADDRQLCFGFAD